MTNVVPFRDPNAPLEGPASLAVRRAYRARCQSIAPQAVAAAFSVVNKGVCGVDLDDAVPIFVAAMRRELRRVWPGL